MAAYTELSNVAQVNDALVTYADNTDAVTGLAAIKEAMLATIADAQDCPQCSATGKIEAGVTICPLCSGMTKTSGQYRAKVQVIGYEPLPE